MVDQDCATLFNISEALFQSLILIPALVIASLVSDIFSLVIIVFKAFPTSAPLALVATCMLVIYPSISSKVILYSLATLPERAKASLRSRVEVANRLSTSFNLFAISI